MEIRKITVADIPCARQLIREVFDTHVAPLYSQFGNDEFYKYLVPGAFEKRLAVNHWGLVAIKDGQMAGLIEIRDNAHISMLFVASKWQKQGIGRKLVETALAQCQVHCAELAKITVHASPNAVAAYRQLGFAPVAYEKEVNGIRFVTMERGIA